VKTFDLPPSIILIVASLVLVRYRRLWSFLKDEEWHPFQSGLFRNPIGTAVEIALGLALLCGGGFMLWLWSR
jgi:hypothetical protein